MAKTGSDFTKAQELMKQETELNEKLEYLIERWSYLAELAENEIRVRHWTYSIFHDTYRHIAVSIPKQLIEYNQYDKLEKEIIRIR